MTAVFLPRTTRFTPPRGGSPERGGLATDKASRVLASATVGEDGFCQARPARATPGPL